MKLSIAFLSLVVFLSLHSLADTYEYKLDGMSCGGCKKMVKTAVCVLPGIKTCDVEIGSMKLTAESGKTLDQASITKALEQLNAKNKSNYTISSSSKVEETSAETKTK